MWQPSTAGRFWQNHDEIRFVLQKVTAFARVRVMFAIPLVMFLLISSFAFK
jgi:hypothetical protein